MVKPAFLVFICIGLVLLSPNAGQKTRNISKPPTKIVCNEYPKYITDVPAHGINNIGIVTNNEVNLTRWNAHRLSTRRLLTSDDNFNLRDNVVSEGSNTLQNVLGPNILEDPDVTSDMKSSVVHKRIKRDKLEFEDDPYYDTDRLRNLADSFPKSSNEMSENDNAIEDEQLIRKKYKRLPKSNTNGVKINGLAADAMTDGDELFNGQDYEGSISQSQNSLLDVYPEVVEESENPLQMTELIRKKRLRYSKRPESYQNVQPEAVSNIKESESSNNLDATSGPQREIITKRHLGLRGRRSSSDDVSEVSRSEIEDGNAQFNYSNLDTSKFLRFPQKLKVARLSTNYQRNPRNILPRSLNRRVYVKRRIPVVTGNFQVESLVEPHARLDRRPEIHIAKKDRMARIENVDESRPVMEHGDYDYVDDIEHPASVSNMEETLSSYVDDDNSYLEEPLGDFRTSTANKLIEHRNDGLGKRFNTDELIKLLVTRLKDKGTHTDDDFKDEVKRTINRFHNYQKTLSTDKTGKEENGETAKSLINLQDLIKKLIAKLGDVEKIMSCKGNTNITNNLKVPSEIQSRPKQAPLQTDQKTYANIKQKDTDKKAKTEEKTGDVRIELKQSIKKSDTNMDNQEGNSKRESVPHERRKKINKRNWSEWTNWSSCSVTCGRGRQIRWRFCLRHCDEAETEMKEKTCKMHVCPKYKFLGIF